jgi:GNAT superfamily N-acetyltransferase
MPGHLSSREREYAVLVGELRALDEDIHAARAAARTGTTGPGLDLHLHPERAAVAQGEHVRLPAGDEIVIRPILPADFDRLAVGFGRLGALSRFRRFRETVDHLTAEQLTELTDIDHDRHEALVAFDAASGDGIAVARYIRDADDPTLAEVACTVLDAWQGRGVGRALVRRLADRARSAGIDRLRGLMLVGHEAPRRLIAEIADETYARRDGGTIEITAKLREGGA